MQGGRQECAHHPELSVSEFRVMKKCSSSGIECEENKIKEECWKLILFYDSFSFGMEESLCQSRELE